ncbi:MAG: PQQ-dependent sugar dehydrogenase [bacterium]|nr:PQQ-dependent sugar dehydrogenase [bacterium]
MRRLLILMAATVIPFTACSSDQTQQVRPPDTPQTGSLEVAYPNLTFERPLWFGHAGDNSGRVFVIEQAGLILVFDSANATAVVDTFLDIRVPVNDGGNEEGLLGLAFHPDFETNGFFYVNYTASSPRRTIVSRFTASPSSSNNVDEATEIPILTFDQPYSNHNGGCLQFGPDGYLYIATGDGGSGGDPHDNGQNRRTLLGKILRIDINSAEDGNQYAIPDDNPFANATDSSRPEIFAYGLRNPWRFSFDPANGRLWAADVGQNAIEEIDIIESGKNYGWSVMEGNDCFKPDSGCDTTGLVRPIFQYTHADGQSVTGGYVYRGAKVPGLVGRYLFADFVSGRIWSLHYTPGQPASVTQLPKTSLMISSFGVDAEGELYVTSFDGKLYRFGE